MIDKKKNLARLEKKALRTLPLLNFAIVILSIIEPIGQLLRIKPIQALKPIPIVLMIVYADLKNSQTNHSVVQLIKAGLCFGLVGDVLLMSNDMPSFMTGTCYFMISHLIYMVAYGIGEEVKEIKPKYRTIRSVLYGVAVLAVLHNWYMMWDVFPSKLLFAPYAAILGLEVALALKRYQKAENNSFRFTLLGVILFVISDNLLAFLKFNQIKTDMGRAIVMLTYYAAQYFILHGALHQSKLAQAVDEFKQNKKKST